MVPSARLGFSLGSMPRFVSQMVALQRKSYSLRATSPQEFGNQLPSFVCGIDSVQLPLRAFEPDVEHLGSRIWADCAGDLVEGIYLAGPCPSK